MNEINVIKDVSVPIFCALLGIMGAAWVSFQILKRTLTHEKQLETERTYKELATQHLNAKEFRKRKLIYFQLVIGNIERIWQKQNDAIDVFIKTVTHESIQLPQLELKPFHDVKRLINSINQENYYLAYIEEFGTEKEIVDEFNSIYKYIEFFEGEMEIIKDSVMVAFKRDGKRKEKYKKLVEDLMDEASKILLSIDKNRRPELFELLDMTFTNFYENQNEDASFKYYQENFIDMLKAELIAFTNHEEVPPSGPLHRKIVDLSLGLKRATFLYNEMFQQVQFEKESIEIHYKLLNNNFLKFKPFTKRLIEKDFHNS